MIIYNCQQRHPKPPMSDVCTRRHAWRWH